MKLKTRNAARYFFKFVLLALIGASLSGCYDSISLDEPTRSVNRHYGFYQFYDNPDDYYAPYPNRHARYGYGGPSANRYYHQQQIQQVQQIQQIQHHQANHYYQQAQNPRRQQANDPQPLYAHQDGNHNNRIPNPNLNPPAQQPAADAIQEQILSDRALAQRLQNEEVARAQQEASDRAMAEHLQAAEYQQLQ